jgi:nucleotide-binding universal stress UspA family protein
VSTAQTIAVGFDGSVASESALRWALHFAVDNENSVLLVHAVGLLEHLGQRDVSVEFEETVNRLCLEAGIDRSRVRWHVSDGDACSVLLRVTASPTFATLLVVGTRGQGAHGGHLLGSTSLQLAERSTVPLVIVPSDS